MHTYTNPFHSPQYQGSKPIITTSAAPEEYKGHLIFKIHKAHFDVVQNGALVTQMAGLNGARGAVDRRQPQAAINQTAPEKTRLQRAGRGKCLATLPGAVPGLHDTDNGRRS